MSADRKTAETTGADAVGRFLATPPRIAASAYVAPNATVIGDVVIGEDSSVWYGCTLRGDVHQIRIGARTNVQDGTVIHGAHGAFPVIIGDDVNIGHVAVLHACTVEDGAFIGIGAIVLDGAVVGAGAMIAAGALVTPGKRVPPGELWAGQPAKLLRPLTERDHANFAGNTQRYLALTRLHRARDTTPPDTTPPDTTPPDTTPHDTTQG